MPTTTLGRRCARLAVRLGAQQKLQIEQAASSLGLSVSDFAIGALVKASREALIEARVTRLSARDTRIFLRMLDRPAKPNAALRRAAARARVRD